MVVFFLRVVQGKVVYQCFTKEDKPLIMMFIFLLLSTTVRGLELDWIPAGDGPLPLSAAYRERLTRLCDVVDRAKGPLPPSILER